MGRLRICPNCSNTRSSRMQTDIEHKFRKKTHIAEIGKARIIKGPQNTNNLKRSKHFIRHITIIQTLPYTWLKCASLRYTPATGEENSQSYTHFPGNIAIWSKSVCNVIQLQLRLNAFCQKAPNSAEFSRSPPRTCCQTSDAHYQ